MKQTPPQPPLPGQLAPLFFLPLAPWDPGGLDLVTQELSPRAGGLAIFCLQEGSPVLAGTAFISPRAP